VTTTRMKLSTERTRAIEEEASAWLVRRDSGTWTSDDAVRLEEWLNDSSRHRVAFWRLEKVWEEAARLKALGAGVVGQHPPPRGEWNLTPFFDTPPRDRLLEDDNALEMQDDIETNSQYDTDWATANSGVPVAADPYPPCEGLAKTRRALTITAFASAASVLLMVGAGTYLWPSSSGDRYVTPIGGLASVPLRDGSKVTLNTATEVHVALSGHERDIELERGEAFFEVAKDAKRPFVVNAGKKRVIAVGTQFSVRREGDAIRVVVSEGTVRIEDRPRTASAPALPLTSADSADAVLLSAGSVANAGSAGVLVQKETESKTQEQLSWRAGVLMFRDQTLGKAAAEFNRYNERHIVIRDPAIANLKIEGSFRATNVNAFVRLIESGLPVRATEENSQVLLSAN
jgi:transmembrane sensor